MTGLPSFHLLRFVAHLSLTSGEEACDLGVGHPAPKRVLQEQQVRWRPPFIAALVCSGHKTSALFVASLSVDEVVKRVSRLRHYNASFTRVPRDCAKHTRYLHRRTYPAVTYRAALVSRGVARLVSAYADLTKLFNDSFPNGNGSLSSCRIRSRLPALSYRCPRVSPNQAQSTRSKRAGRFAQSKRYAPTYGGATTPREQSTGATRGPHCETDLLTLLCRTTHDLLV